MAPTQHKPQKKALSVREHARRRGALGGADAQALEGALSITEKERDTALVQRNAALAKVAQLQNHIQELQDKVLDLEQASPSIAVKKLENQVRELQKRVRELEDRAPIDGWALTKKVKSDRYHLYKGGRSMCGKHYFKGPYTPLKDGDAPDTRLDCMACWKEYQKIKSVAVVVPVPDTVEILAEAMHQESVASVKSSGKGIAISKDACLKMIQKYQDNPTTDEIGYLVKTWKCGQRIVDLATKKNTSTGTKLAADRLVKTAKELLGVMSCEYSSEEDYDKAVDKAVKKLAKALKTTDDMR